MSNSEREEIHNWIDKLAEVVLGDLSQHESLSKSFVFLDSQTLNLLLIYILMNKEMEISKNNMPSSEQFIEIEKEIEALIAENNQQFKELIKETKKRS